MSDKNTHETMTRPVPFAPVGDNARIWHPALIILGGFVAFMFWAIVPQITLGVFDGIAGITDIQNPNSMTVRYGLLAIGAGFALILLHFLFWTRAVERRPLASIGFQGPGFARRYVAGLGVGIIFAIVGTMASAIIATELGYRVPDMAPGGSFSLAEGVLLTALLIVPVFLLQAGTEEVVFRGWMLSALSARASITIAVIVSGIAFGLFHLDRLLIDPKFAAIFMAGTSVMGVFLGAWAVHARSIAGPMGFHGAYNVLLLLTGYLAAASRAAPTDTGPVIFSRMMLETMSEAPLYQDYITLQQTFVVAMSIIGLIVILVSRKPDEQD